MKNKIVSDNNFEQQLRQELKDLVVDMPIKNAVYFDVASQNWLVSVSNGGVGYSGNDAHLLMIIRSRVAIGKGLIPKVIVTYKNNSTKVPCFTNDKSLAMFLLEGLPIMVGERGNIYFQEGISLSLDFPN